MSTRALIPAAFLFLVSTACAVHGWKAQPASGPKLAPKLLDHQVRLTMATGVIELMVSEVTATYLSGKVVAAAGGTVEFDLQSARRAEVHSRTSDGSIDRRRIDPKVITASPDLIAGRTVQLMTENGFVVLHDATVIAPSWVAGRLHDQVNAWVRVDRRQVLQTEIREVDWLGTATVGGGIWLGLLYLSRLLG
jgi:hypothetical protein